MRYVSRRRDTLPPCSQQQRRALGEHKFRSTCAAPTLKAATSCQICSRRVEAAKQALITHSNIWRGMPVFRTRLSHPGATFGFTEEIEGQAFAGELPGGAWTARLVFVW